MKLAVNYTFVNNMPKWTVQLTGHTVYTNMLYSILHSNRNECEIENNNLAGFTHINTGERYTPDWFSSQENGVCRKEGRRRLDQGGSGWRHHQLIHCWTPTCPCSGVPLLWLRYAYTTRCTGPPIKINGPGSRLYLPYVGSFFSQTTVCLSRIPSSQRRKETLDGIVCHVGCWQN